MPYVEQRFNHTITALFIIAFGMVVLSFEFMPAIAGFLVSSILIAVIVVFMFYTAKIFNVVLQKKGNY